MLGAVPYAGGTALPQAGAQPAAPAVPAETVQPPATWETAE